jgi:BON domain
MGLVVHRGGSVPTPEIDTRRSDAMNACPISTSEPVEVLMASPLPQLRKLMVTTTEHEVVITGRVATYYLKQLAQETLRPTLGDRRLVNHVEVRPN